MMRSYLCCHALAAVVAGATLCDVQAATPPELVRALEGGLRAARAKSVEGPRAVADKIDPRLLRSGTSRATALGGAIAHGPPRPEAAWRDGGRLRVVVAVDGVASAHAEALHAAGLTIEIVNDRFGQVQGWIAETAVPGLAALPGVRVVTPAWPALHAAGRVTTEGDRASRADQVRALGVRGDGVLVGVISDGIDRLATSQASGDLPPVTVPPDARCRRGSGDEGTAMLEIVHDLAPGASLLFSGPRTSLEMIDTIDCLAAAGADVIVDDLFFPGEPYFEDGPIALTAADAVAAGVSYHTAAGNYGDGKYLVDDYRAGPEGFHDFDPGAGQDILDRVIVPPGGDLVCFLQWADLFGASGNDYDLVAFEPVTATILDTSTNLQTGTQNPLEVVAITNPLSFALEVGIVVHRYTGVARPMKLLCLDAPLQYSSDQFGISGHAARPEVIAVAAIDARDPGLDTPEPFTSRGPAPIFFPAAVARPKPDLAAFDGVATTLPRNGPFNPFFGTSAAAPHSAAVAALVLSKSPGLTPAQVRGVLTSTAVDVAAPGFDPVVGHGRVDALAAVSAIGAPTSTSTTVPATTTTVFPTTSTTLPACDPADCDGDVCTANDACVAGVCRPGAPVTPAEVAGRLRDDPAAAAACAGDRRQAVAKVRTPLAKAARLLDRAHRTAGGKRSRALAQAGQALRQARNALGKGRARLSSACTDRLAATIGAAEARRACLR